MSKLTGIDWGVILHQGRYHRPDVGKYLNDAEHKEEIKKRGRRAKGGKH